MYIEELMAVDDATFIAAFKEITDGDTNEQQIEYDVRRQFRDNIQGEDTSDETLLMLEQKYGLAPIKFTRVEEKVIRKQSRRDARLKETVDAE